MPHFRGGGGGGGGSDDEESTDDRSELPENSVTRQRPDPTGNNTQPTSPHRTRGGTAEQPANLDQQPTEQKRLDDTFKEVSQSSDRSVNETRERERQPVEPSRTRGRPSQPTERQRADTRPPGRSGAGTGRRSVSEFRTGPLMPAGTGRGEQNRGFEAVERQPTNEVIHPNRVSFREQSSTEKRGDVDWSLGQGGPEDEIEAGLVEASDRFQERSGDVARDIGGKKAEAYVEPVAGELNPAQTVKDIGEGVELFHRSAWEDAGIRDEDGGLGEFDRNPSIDFREGADDMKKGVDSAIDFAEENPYEAAGIGTAVGVGVLTGGVSGRGIRKARAARASNIDEAARIGEPSFKTRAQLGPSKGKGSKRTTDIDFADTSGRSIDQQNRFRERQIDKQITGGFDEGDTIGGPRRSPGDRPLTVDETGRKQSDINPFSRSTDTPGRSIDPDMSGADSSVMGSTARGGAAGGLLGGPKSRIEAAQSTSFTDDDLDRSAGLLQDLSPITNTRSKQRTSLRDSWLDRAASRQDTKPESIDQELDKRFNGIDNRTDTTTDITTDTTTRTDNPTRTDQPTDIDIRTPPVSTPTHTPTTKRPDRPRDPDRPRFPVGTPDRPRAPPLDISLPDEKKRRRRGDDLDIVSGAWTNPVVDPGELDESLDMALGGIDEELGF